MPESMRISAAERRSKAEQHFKMIKDCAKNKMDLILTKSVYRFARNTLDSLQTVRALKAKRIGMYFEQEGINTLTATSEFILTIWSAFAQNESWKGKINIRSLRDAYSHGIGYLSQDRKNGGILLDLPIRHDVLLQEVPVCPKCNYWLFG